MCPRGGHRRDHGEGHALPDGQCGPAGGRAVTACEGRLGEVEALVEPVGAADQVALRLLVATAAGRLGHDVDAAQLERVDAEADGASSSIADSTPKMTWPSP